MNRKKLIYIFHYLSLDYAIYTSYLLTIVNDTYNRFLGMKYTAIVKESYMFLIKLIVWISVSIWFGLLYFFNWNTSGNMFFFIENTNGIIIFPIRIFYKEIISSTIWILHKLCRWRKKVWTSIHLYFRNTHFTMYI